MDQASGRAPAAPMHPRVPPWIGDVIAAAIIMSSAFIRFPDTQSRPLDALMAVLIVAPAVVLPLRRRWPIPVLAACVAFFALAALTGGLWPGPVLAVAIAMFGVANRSSRRTTIVVALAAIAVIIATNVLGALISVFDERVFALAVTVAFAAAAGDGTRSRREFIAAMTERAERAEQTRESEARRRVSEERLRIARDLHDAVAHQIAVISLNAGVASSAIRSRPDDAEEAVRTIRSAARTVLGEIGSLLEVLRADDSDGRDTSPQPGFDRFDELVRQFEAAGLAITVRIEGDVSRAEGATGIVAYRVIQECLTNALKHGTSRAHILVEADADTLKIVVTNPTGAPRDENAGAQARGTGLGLIGLQERVAAVRGVLEAGPTPGGWRATATMPLEKKDER